MRFTSPLAALAMLAAGAGTAFAWSVPAEALRPFGLPLATPVEAAQTGPGCPKLPSRSPFTGKRATIFIKNSPGKETLRLYWIDGVGNWEFKEEIAPGKSTSRSTIIGARFVLVDPGGRCVQTPIVNNQTTTIMH